MSVENVDLVNPFQEIFMFLIDEPSGLGVNNPTQGILNIRDLTRIHGLTVLLSQIQNHSGVQSLPLDNFRADFSPNLLLELGDAKHEFLSEVFPVHLFNIG